MAHMDRLVKEGRDIAIEHGIHARNAESAGSDITGALSREKPCFPLFGGGDVPSATIVSGFLSSPKNNTCLQKELFGLPPWNGFWWIKS